MLLGKHGTAASRVEYARIVSEWEAAGRSLLRPATPTPSDLSVNELILRYWKHAEVYYGFDGERGDEGCFRSVLRVLRESYGHTQAIAFGPLALKACRMAMVEKGWSRNYTNAQVDRIRRMFRWAASEQLLPSTIYQELKSVAGLRRGKTEAHETARVRPANPEHVEAALLFMPQAVQGMVRLQQLTGCRPAEACLLRSIDLDMSNPKCWVYRPGSDQGLNGEHKTAHHGHDRLILLGPRAQEVVRGYLRTDLSGYLFCPKDSTQERNEKVKARSKEPGKRKYKRKAKPRRAPGDRYTARVYARAIVRACDLADFAARTAIEKSKAVAQGREQHDVPDKVLARDRLILRWGPNRLRHSRATELRPHGLDVVKTILGHTKVETSQIYAEKDMAAAMELMAKIG
jgi:integrase